ncbi:hypothetical protein MYP_1826 [Sporocytophaga myxococcoides]|uniref:Uncharacterized protein n=1 Tax=Sporocytophaga myxococcoides TaxID=153721 RepID=A0A098LE84_9BACT|nr:hypothetical protein [Sporocytophaga myxococcoides]GAL84598.1 hypothetical protein MYP_1826 [Sporocytophaga myxococcoides]
MDRRTRINLKLFIRRFKKNYEYYTNLYSGKNCQMYLDQFERDNLKLAQVLFGREGVRMMKEYIKSLHLST